MKKGRIEYRRGPIIFFRLMKAAYVLIHYGLITNWMMIKTKAVALKHVEQVKFDSNERMDDAVAKLLANRAAIAGESDSESDSDSDSGFDSDDDYP